MGEPFFFRCGDPLGDGLGVTDAEPFFFFGLGDGDSSVSTTDFFFFGETVGEGDGDSSAAVELFFFFGEGDGVGDSSSPVRDFFEGVAVGVGDFFLVELELFFLRGVGVGEAKIFLSLSPKVSAGLAASIGQKTTAITMIIRRSM